MSVQTFSGKSTNAGAPLFSVIIPTRDRAKYLDCAIRTCLAQRFTNFELIVADNCSAEATRETVERYPDPRVRYYRSDQALAMSENWERAIRHAQGEYITVLGDDDALLLHALADAESLIRATGTKALRWALTYYRWPDVSAALGPNTFVVPLQTGSCWESSAGLIPQVLSGKRHYNELPGLYNSFVQRDILSTLRARTGKVFCSMTPDIYSGFAIAAQLERFVSVQRPMGMAGLSARSNGEAVMRQTKNSDVAQDFRDLNEQFGFRWHSRAPPVSRSLPALVVESFEQARDHFPALKHIKIDRRNLASRIVAERMQSYSADPEAVKDALDGVRQWTRSDARLSEWFENYVQALPQSEAAPNDALIQPTRGHHHNQLILDAAEFGVQDTVGSSELFEKLTRASEHPIKPPREKTWKTVLRPAIPPLILESLHALTAKRPR